jgi:hypothetical protein
MSAQYEVIGCNDEQTTCDHCGRQGLKRTVILRSLDDGEVVRFGSDCALRAAAVPGVQTKSQLDRKVYAAQVETEQISSRYGQAVAVLADPERIARNWAVRVNSPFWNAVWTLDDERCYWTQARDNAADELAGRS